MNSRDVIVGLDIGAKRIGVSRGDLEVRLASPLPAISNDNEVMDVIISLVREIGANLVVIGLPRDSYGSETLQSEFSRSFAARLSEALLDARLNVRITLQDESLTSIAAEDNLRSRKDFNDKMLRDGTLDSEAAALILQDFLEGQHGTAQG